MKVRAATHYCRAPILGATVRLERFADPLLPRPVVASVVVNVNGRPVRVQTTASSAGDALDALQRALRTAIERIDRHHGHQERVAPTSTTIDEAVADLEALDYEFRLFYDVEADEDTLVYRGSPTGYRLARVRHIPLPTRPVTPIAIDIHDAPRLSASAAAGHLAGSGRPWLFFAHSATGRGAVLHVRRDGRYALVTLE